MKIRKLTAMVMTAAMLAAPTAVMAEGVEDTPVVSTYDAQKLDASYTLALNAINNEDYDTAKEYLSICFVYCDPRENPDIYADLLLKQACIDVIEEKYDMAFMLLDAAIQLQPDLADAYLVRTQLYTSEGDFDKAVENLEKYVELTEDTSLYETVAQLYEANGNALAAQEAYDKFIAGAGAENLEAGFQAGLYRMESGSLEEAIDAFLPYTVDETYGAGAWYNIGVCRMNLGDYAEAVEAFDACQEQGGEYLGLYYNRGICYLLQEAWEEAAADFAQSVETEPFVDDALYNLAVCQMQTEQYEEAVASFTALIDGKTATNDTEEGETAEAETGEAEAESAEAETEAEPEPEERVVNYAAYYFRAVCNGALGNLEEALADYTVCIDNGYELAQSYYQRAQVNAALGDTENQTSDLENSLKYANE